MSHRLCDQDIGGGAQLIDVRGKLDPSSLVERRKAPKDWRRSPGGVTRIVLHQWGARVGLSKWALARIAARSSSELEEFAKRAQRVPYHVSAGLTSSGAFAVRSWDAEVYTWHAGVANATSVGVGVMGRFPRFWSAWSSKHTPLAEAREMMSGAKLAVETAAAMCADDAPLLLTHSQVGGQRQADPGELIIADVVAPLVEAGVVRVEPDFAVGGGQPWPDLWRVHLGGVA